MYCLSCGTSLPEEALFCFKCGKLIPKGNGEYGESEHTPTVASVSSPSDPYSPRPSTSYGPLPPEGGTQNPYAPLSPYGPLAPPPPPPHRRRFFPGYLKGLLSGMLVILLLSGGLGALLLLKQGALPPSVAHSVRPTATPQPIVPSARSTATTPVPPTATPAPPTATPAPPTPTPAPPTPTQTLSISTETSLSDGRTEAWKSTSHAHLIQTRWILSNGQWTNWTTSAYPPSDAGVIGLSAYAQQSITYLKVQLDDGSCWQEHKLSTSSNATWASFSSC